MMKYLYVGMRQGAPTEENFQMENKFGNALIWSAQARLRFGTGRHVCQSESGDMSPQSKLGHGHKFSGAWFLKERDL
jgi:hypothetical protein